MSEEIRVKNVVNCLGPENCLMVMHDNYFDSLR